MTKRQRGSRRKPPRRKRWPLALLQAPKVAETAQKSNLCYPQSQNRKASNPSFNRLKRNKTPSVATKPTPSISCQLHKLQRQKQKSTPCPMTFQWANASKTWTESSLKLRRSLLLPNRFPNLQWPPRQCQKLPKRSFRSSSHRSCPIIVKSNSEKWFKIKPPRNLRLPQIKGNKSKSPKISKNNRN